MNLNLLEGKTAIVTGGTRGIGFAIVKTYLENGAKVALCGSRQETVDKALAHMEEMVRDGADIIDIGAESSRPGFKVMPADEEIERLMPYLEAVVRECPVPVSVDTFKAETASTAWQAGADILNDIWGLQYTSEPGAMARVAAEAGCPVVVMHNRDSKTYNKDIIEEMQDFFRQSIAVAVAAGINQSQLILDPGIGFGKTVEGNLEVLRRQEELLTIDGEAYPLLLGTSRKSFMDKTLGLAVGERMEATGATCVLGITKGAGIVRVHDVKPIARMCRMTDTILAEESADRESRRK